MNLQAITGNRVFRLLRDTFDSWMEDNALRLSAALAYNSIFSIAPLLVIAISIAGLVLGDDAAGTTQRATPRQDRQAGCGGRADNGAKRVEAFRWLGRRERGIATLILGVSGVFGQLKDALNTIWEVKAKDGAGVCGFLCARLLNFGMGSSSAFIC